jgi:hypothetical protein
MLHQNQQLSRFQAWLDYNTYGWKSWLTLVLAMAFWVMLAILGYVG